MVALHRDPFHCIAWPQTNISWHGVLLHKPSDVGLFSAFWKGVSLAKAHARSLNSRLHINRYISCDTGKEVVKVKPEAHMRFVLHVSVCCEIAYGRLASRRAFIAPLQLRGWYSRHCWASSEVSFRWVPEIARDPNSSYPTKWHSEGSGSMVLKR